MGCGLQEVIGLLGGWRLVGLIPEDEGWARAVNTHRLIDLHKGPEFERALRGILRAVSDDPAFVTPESGVSTSRWKNPLALKPR